MTAACGVVLAAGAGSRYGQPKAEIVIEGARLLDRAIRTLRDGGCHDVVAVVRPGTTATDATVVVNPDPARGLGSSLRLGLQAATGALAVILLADLPGVTPDAVRRVMAAGAPVAVATYAGRRGHPVAIAREHWDEAGRLAVGDEGARPFLLAHLSLVAEVPCVGDPTDIDTPDDLARWAAGRQAHTDRQ
jgi:CTP:molybdopterin cytidylyltransferase MocA